MPRVRDLLLRFRPAGSPGPAGPAGVPADHADRLAAELEPVLAALAPTQEEATAIVEDGRRAAAGIRAAAAARAEALRAAGPARAEAERLRAEAEPPDAGAPAAASSAAASSAVASPATASPDADDALLAALAERASTVAPLHLARVTAAVEALCSPDRGPS